uniref:uncharacterized protein LOC132675525 n=1 Tax=Panthera onca TaxID=9690 RepID=UPI002954E513|nr:uncharacterized protein LOC132675525 [Panthera onca]
MSAGPGSDSLSRCSARGAVAGLQSCNLLITPLASSEWKTAPRHRELATAHRHRAAQRRGSRCLCLNRWGQPRDPHPPHRRPEAPGPGLDPTATVWDLDLRDGHGGRRGGGCHIIGSAATPLRPHSGCRSFAGLMDLKTVLSLPQDPGEFLHPVVYACTAVMLLCLLASVITYVVHQNAIRISRKGRHTLLNFCFHAALTFTVFAGGVNRTKYPILCQAVSAIHTLILLQNLKCLSPLLPKGKCMIIVLFMKKHSSICSDVSPGGSSSASRAPVLQPFCHVRLTILLSTGSCQVLCFSLDQVAPRRLVTCELDASCPANGAGPRNRVGSFPPPRDWPRDRSTEKGPTATPRHRRPGMLWHQSRWLGSPGRRGPAPHMELTPRGSAPVSGRIGASEHRSIENKSPKGLLSTPWPHLTFPSKGGKCPLVLTELGGGLPTSSTCFLLLRAALAQDRRPHTQVSL